jgi:hypothetical protein
MEKFKKIVQTMYGYKIVTYVDANGPYKTISGMDRYLMAHLLTKWFCLFDYHNTKQNFDSFRNCPVGQVAGEIHLVMVDFMPRDYDNDQFALVKIVNK